MCHRGTAILPYSATFGAFPVVVSVAFRDRSEKEKLKMAELEEAMPTRAEQV